MLGGSFWISVLRNGLGAALIMTVFLLLDRPRMPMRKMVLCYMFFGLIVTVGFSLWYMADREGFVRFAGMMCIPVVGIFCVLMSRDTLYLSLYKLTLGFYLLSLTVFCGVDAARIWFDGNLWADIIVRIVMVIVIEFLIVVRIRKTFLAGAEELREEMDLFSAVTVVMSILFAALTAFWPGTRTFSVIRTIQIWTILFMAGIIQYVIFHLYMHRGREHRYRAEKELMEMNEMLLHRQLEIMQKSEKEMARFRHDVRHHMLLVEEYIRNGETEKLLDYVIHYREDLEVRKMEYICGNQTVNAILSAYRRRAREEHIQMTLQARLAEDIAVRDIDLVAILANILENAIQGCIMSHAAGQEICVTIYRKKNKIVIQCRNTSVPEVKFKNGIPQSDKGRGIGISSIMKVVSYYNGEAEFAVEEGMFVARILLNCDAGCDAEHVTDHGLLDREHSAENEKYQSIN